MKSLPILLRNTLIAGLLGVLTTPADAAVRSNLFGRSSRSMMGMGDGGQGELYTVTPGVKSFKAQLKGIGSMGYASGGKRFTMNFARNNPRSMRSPNGRMTFTGLRGGGMRIFMRSLRGAKVGKPMVINPSGALSERGGTAPSESFRFTGFDGFRFTREQLLNDVGVYGAPLAKLVSSGFSSVNTFFQRLATALVIQQDPGTFDSQGPDYIAGTLNDASLGIISGYTDPTASQTILTSQFDLAAFLNPILQTRDLDGDGAVGDFDDRKLLVKIQKFIASNADKILEFLIQYAVQADVQGSDRKSVV